MLSKIKEWFDNRERAKGREYAHNRLMAKTRSNSSDYFYDNYEQLECMLDAESTPFLEGIKQELEYVYWIQKH